MNRWTMLFVALAVLGAAGVCWSDDASSQPHTKVIFEPHGGSLCASGCALSRHPTPPLGQARFEELMAEYAVGSMSEDCQALEELLYYGPQTARMLESFEGRLDPKRRAFLKRELGRELVSVEFRIVDESGRVRVSLSPTTVPFDKRFVFEPLQTVAFQPPQASGTVKRVGLNHIWQRI